MYNFLCQNVPIFPLHILLTIRIDRFWFKGIEKFWLAHISTIWAQKSYNKNMRFLELNQLLILNYLSGGNTENFFGRR